LQQGNLAANQWIHLKTPGGTPEVLACSFKAAMSACAF
jgi:hypothetical protein